jgi:hypothetical protein
MRSTPSFWLALPWIMWHEVRNVVKVTIGIGLWALFCVGVYELVMHLPLTAPYIALQPKDANQWAATLYFGYYCLLVFPPFIAMALLSFLRVFRAVGLWIGSVAGFALVAFVLYHVYRFLHFLGGLLARFLGWIGSLINDVLTWLDSLPLLNLIGRVFSAFGAFVHLVWTAIITSGVAHLLVVMLVVVLVAIVALVTVAVCAYLLYCSHTMKAPLRPILLRIWERRAARARRRGNSAKAAKFSQRASNVATAKADDPLTPEAVLILGLVGPFFVILQGLGVDTDVFEAMVSEE